MSKQRSVWRPTEIKRVIAPVESSTQVVRVLTDAGEGYVKAMGNPEGEHALACEWVGTSLAEWFGLLTFPFSIFQVQPQDVLPFHNKSGRASPGPAFITRAEEGEPWGGAKRELERLSNREHISRLVVFDTWIRNRDRYSKREDGTYRENRNNVFLSSAESAESLQLFAIDHTHCFQLGGQVTKAVANIDKVQDPEVYGLFPEFASYLKRDIVVECAGSLANLPHNHFKRIMQNLPREWDVISDVQEAWVNFICGRGVYLSSRIVDMLFPSEG